MALNSVIYRHWALLWRRPRLGLTNKDCHCPVHSWGNSHMQGSLNFQMHHVKATSFSSPLIPKASINTKQILPLSLQTRG